jgi:P-type E1-E2 ATPase
MPSRVLSGRRPPRRGLRHGLRCGGAGSFVVGIVRAVPVEVIGVIQRLCEQPPSLAVPPVVNERTRDPRTGMWSVGEARWATVATVLFIAGLFAQMAGGPAWLWWALYLACCVAGGWEPGWAGLRALLDHRLDVDLLMVAAAVGAAAIGQVLDGALLIVIFATSGALEAVATRRTAASVRGLFDLAPDRARRLTIDGEESVDAALLEVGDVVVVRPGERICADGRVVESASEVDQASITGEPLPMDKQPGDEVFAGTVNGTGALRVRVARPAHDSVVARIGAMVAQASATKARTQLLIEKIEQRYSIAMVSATLALFVIPLALGAALQPTLLRAMTFMIVASPCAVVLATMPPLLSAIANAGRHGVLVKSAVVMEQLGTVTRVAFDKTGTLTKGRPRVIAIHTLPDAGLADTDLLALAAAAEDQSEHPLARAVVRAARQAGLAIRPAAAFNSAPGRGVQAQVSGRTVDVGRPGHLLDATNESAWAIVDAAEQTGVTAVVVRIDDRPAGVLSLTDQPGATKLSPESKAAKAARVTPIRRSRSGRRSGRQQDTAAHRATLDAAMRSGGVGQRQGVGADADQALTDGLQGGLGGGAGPLGVGGQVKADREAEHGEVAAPQRVAGHGVLPVAAGVAHQQHPAHRRHHLQGVRAQLAAHRVDHHVEALIADGLDQVLAGHDVVVRQGGGSRVGQRGATYGADHGGGTQRAGHPGKGGGQPAQRPVYQHALAGLEMRHISECQVCGGGVGYRRHRQRRVHPGAFQADGHRRVHDRDRGVPALGPGARQRHQRLPDPQALYAFTQRADGAGHLQARHVRWLRQALPVVVQALADVDVDQADGGVADIDRDLTRAWDRVRQLSELEDPLAPRNV